MLTIFSSPRPFKGHFNIIQRNAIKSWTLLKSKCEIILFEDEGGTTKKVAEDFSIKCITDVACNEFGTPLLSDIIAKTQKFAKNEILAYVNPDIILMDDFTEAIKIVKESYKNSFLIVGRRWDLDVRELIDFNETDWKEKLKETLLKNGKIHGLSGMDYWIFPRDIQFNHPPFTNGRWVTDGWLVYQARSRGMPVIDASDIVMAIHQNHPYPQQKKSFYVLEMQRNLKLAGGFSNIMTLRDADWILDSKGLKKPSFPRCIFAKLSLFYPWRLILALKRKLQSWT